MGVEDGEVKRVESFEQVGDVGDEGICQARRKGKFDRGFHDPRLGLDEIDQETRPGGHDEQRELFPDERADPGPKRRDRSVSAGGPRRSLSRLLRVQSTDTASRSGLPAAGAVGVGLKRPQRPVIHQEQDEGERHRHLLRHQPCRIAEANRPDAADARMLHVAEVEPERERARRACSGDPCVRPPRPPIPRAAGAGRRAPPRRRFARGPPSSTGG